MEKKTYEKPITEWVVVMLEGKLTAPSKYSIDGEVSPISDDDTGDPSAKKINLWEDWE